MNGISGWGFIPVALPSNSPIGGLPAGASFGDFASGGTPNSNDFVNNVHSAANPAEKRDLIDAYAAGFIAASRSPVAGPQPAPSYVQAGYTQGLPMLPVGQTGPVAGVPTLQGLEQQRRESFADVMEGFQHFAGLVEESQLPDMAKNKMLDGLSGLMSQLAGLANIGAGGSTQAPPPPAQYPKAPSAGSDVWTHETGKDGTSEIRLGDKYTLNLKEGDQSFTIKNNETGEETRVWGDPHVDKGNDGTNDFDFKKDMTFVLEDGTKITVNTVPAENGTTYSSSLTITNGDNAIQVTGLAGDKDGKDNLKVVQSNAGRTLDNLTADGAQTIYERDGDWVDAMGRSVNQSIIDGAEQAAS
ncbi:DUF1521 domain-containing protein [Terrihabitans sp. B22-R8]|uniref:DUF1521 domain-containing protein n=1 Tax=Terrihabitans sp. B22-R8 TaxID=3425128 RepID=UPI00403C923D